MLLYRPDLNLNLVFSKSLFAGGFLRGGSLCEFLYAGFNFWFSVKLLTYFPTTGQLCPNFGR